MFSTAAAAVAATGSKPGIQTLLAFQLRCAALSVAAAPDQVSGERLCCVTPARLFLGMTVL